MSTVRDENEMVSGDHDALNWRHRTTTELCAQAFSDAKDQGCEIVLDKTQDPDGRLSEALTNVHGFRVVETDLDNTTVVLALPTDEEILVKSVSVDGVLCPPEEDSESNFRGAKKDVAGVVFNWSPDDTKVSGEETFPISGKDQKVFGEFYFRTAHGREGDKQWTRLVLMEYSFGVRDCFNQNDKRGLFVHKVTVAATPFQTYWQGKCDKLVAYPTPTASEFTNEKATTIGCGSSFTPSNPFNVSTQRQSKRAVTAKSFEWKPCKFTGPVETRSVTWTWEMLTWDTGNTLKLDKPVSYIPSTIPKLPKSYDPEGFGQGEDDFVADARWRIPNVKEDVGNVGDTVLGNVGWDIVIQLHLAYVEKMWKVGPLARCPKPRKQMLEIKSTVNLEL